MLPAVVVAVAALSAGAAVGRKYLKGEVAKRKQTAITDASRIVKTRIGDQASRYIARNLKNYVRNMLVKLLLLGIVVLAAQLGWTDQLTATICISLLLVSFIIYDATNLWPHAMLILGELRRHKWRPRYALAEIVAANVFDQVLAEAKARKTDMWSEITLRLSGENPQQVSNEIAAAVANIARETSWDDLRPYLLSAVLKFAGVLILYSIAVFLLITAFK